jgi:hypothetical protein
MLLKRVWVVLPDCSPWPRATDAADLPRTTACIEDTKLLLGTARLWWKPSDEAAELGLFELVACTAPAGGRGLKKPLVVVKNAVQGASTRVMGWSYNVSSPGVIPNSRS